MLPGFLLRPVAIALLLMLAASPPSNAEDQKGRGAADPKDPVLAPRPALTASVRTIRTSAPLKLYILPLGITGKSESFTDQGRELPFALPNYRERAKLEAARIAVAAARAQAGPTTRMTPTADPATPLYAAPVDKLERLRSAQPGAVPTDPALSGLPSVLRSRQKQGAATPTARELEKLKATAKSPVTPETQKETER